MPLPDFFSTDPRDPDFLKGVSFEHKCKMLKTQSPRRYRGLLMLVDEVLRDVFSAIGPDPTAERKKV